jgi:hypothetical protein
MIICRRDLFVALNIFTAGLPSKLAILSSTPIADSISEKDLHTAKESQSMATCTI